MPGWPEIRSRRRGTRGQSLVEMAIALPILLALLIGIVEMSRAWNARQVLTNAAREGARLGVIQGKTAAEVQAAVGARLTDAGLDPGLATVTITGVDAATGTPTVVQVDYPFQFLFLGPVVDLLGGGSTIPGSITLATTATMRHE